MNRILKVHATRTDCAGNSLLDMLAVKAGTKLGELLGVIIIYGNGFLYKLLSTCGLLAIMALIVYGVYRKMKQQKSIAKPVFFGEVLCLVGKNSV